MKGNYCVMDLTGDWRNCNTPRNNEAVVYDDLYKADYVQFSDFS